MPQNECVVVAPTPRRSSRLVEGCKRKELIIPSNSTTTTKNKKRSYNFDRDEHFKSTSVTMENPRYNKNLPPMVGENLEAWFASLIDPVALFFAEKGLELYKKAHAKDPDFKIEKVLYDYRLKIGHLQTSFNHYCGHVCFTAKPMSSHCTKHFFVELLKDRFTNRWKTVRCYTFKPIDDTGFEHRCIMCPDGKIHPSPTEYEFGYVESYEYRPTIYR